MPVTEALTRRELHRRKLLTALNHIDRCPRGSFNTACNNHFRIAPSCSWGRPCRPRRGPLRHGTARLIVRSDGFARCPVLGTAPRNHLRKASTQSTLSRPQH